MKSFHELPDYRDLRKLWKQEPVTPPVPDLELTPDHWVERGAEVIGWSLARLEHWISASGWLRAWLRLNLFLSIVLTSAGVLLLPPVAQCSSSSPGQPLDRPHLWRGLQARHRAAARRHQRGRALPRIRDLPADPSQAPASTGLPAGRILPVIHLNTSNHQP